MGLRTIKDRRKGVATIIGAIIAVGVILTVFTAVILYSFSASRKQQESFDIASRISLMKEMENINMTKETTNSSTLIILRNEGSIRSYLKYLTYKIDNDSYVLDLYGFQTHSAALAGSGITLEELVNGGFIEDYMYLDPFGYAIISITGDVTPVIVTTMYGSAIPYRRYSGGYTEVSQVAASVIVYPINLGGSIEELISRADVTIDSELVSEPVPGDLGYGMKRYKKHMILWAEYENVNISSGTTLDTVQQFWFLNAYIGLDPDWTETRQGPPKYNIMLTGFYSHGGWTGRYNRITIEGEGTIWLDNDLYDYGYDGWRLVIEGFTPDPDDSDALRLRYRRDYYGINEDLTGMETLGLWWLYGRNADEAWLTFRGHADRVKIYAVEYGQQEFSYRPFFISMDVDNNGVPEFVFATEDASYGWAATCNDVVTSYLYDDWSVRPFWINLTGYQIQAEQYAMVQVAIRMYFHDNVGSDTDEIDNTDRVLFGVYLIDMDTGEIASSREYIYQELDDLEDTYPPNRSFFIQTIPLIVPDTPGKTYIIGIAFMDPYDDCYHTELSGRNGYDDGDFIIAIEWLGVTYFARPP